MDLHNIREDYKFDSLLEANLLENPFDQFKDWFETYQLLRPKDANAMAIAPSTRTTFLTIESYY